MWFIPFLKQYIIFRNSHSIPNFEFWVRVFHEIVFKQKCSKKSLVFRFLGDFPIDRFLR